MECPGFETELARRLDERLDPRSRELQAHAAGCIPCRSHLENAVLMLRAVVAWRQELPAVAPDLASRITERIGMELIPAVQPVMPERPDSSRRPTSPVRESSKAELRPIQSPDRFESRHSWHAWAVLSGSVAAIWFVFTGTTLRDPENPGGRRDQAGIHVPVPTSKPKIDLGTVLVSAGEAYSQVANDSLEAAQDFALLWPTSSKPVTPATTPSSTGSEWGSGWTRELSPISDSVEDTWDFLRRTVPHVEKSAS